MASTHRAELGENALGPEVSSVSFRYARDNQPELVAYWETHG